MLQIILITALGSLLLIVFVSLLRAAQNKGEDELVEWSEGIEFTTTQLAAMRSLWQWYIRGRAPSSDALSVLAPAELADLLQKCELSMLPPHLRAADEATLRSRFTGELTELGMNEIQAQIVTGMKFGKFGPAKTFSE